MTTTPSTVSAHLRRLVSVALFSAAFAIGGGALATPPLASAEKEWDIGTFDDCMELGLGEVECCKLSGGVLKYDNAGRFFCTAPPAAQPQDSSPTGPPPVAEDPSAPPVPRDPRVPPRNAATRTSARCAAS